MEKLSPNTQLVTIDQLLLRDRRNITTIAKAVSLSNPEIALYSVKILDQLSQTQDSLVKLFQTSGIHEVILRGYIDKLKTEQPFFFQEHDPLGQEDPDEQNKQMLDKSVRIAIIKLLLNNIRSPTPNLVHFLCGFNIESSVSKSDLEASQWSALREIVALLELQNTMRQYPQFAESCFQFIYRLSTLRDTSGPTMTFLRSQDFFVKLLKLFPTRILSTQDSFYNHHLNSKAWLLKLISLELHIGNSSSYKHKLFNELFVTDPSLAIESTERSFGFNMEIEREWEQPRMKILELLDSVEFRFVDTTSILSLIQAWG